MHRMLGVFAKQPVPGRVKTRLAASASPDWAACVASAFLRDTLDRLAGVDARRAVVFDPPEATAYFTDRAQGRYELVPQGEGDLGQRMARFIALQLSVGVEAVVLVGTDSPTLSAATVVSAYDYLKSADVVLGPATDGGYYLLGCRRLPPIFDGIAWGSCSVLHDTVLRLGGWNIKLLPPWYDVDTLEDWWLLRGHLAALRAAGTDPEVPHTEALMGEPMP